MGFEETCIACSSILCVYQLLPLEAISIRLKSSFNPKLVASLVVLIALTTVAISPRSERVYGNAGDNLIQTPPDYSATKTGIGQRILIITQNRIVGGVSSYEYPAIMASRMNLPFDVISTDVQTISNSTFYDSEGNGKYCFIFLNCYGYANLSALQISYLDFYERAFNVTEASLYPQSSLTYATRYGVIAIGNQIAVSNVLWTSNNIRMEYSQKGLGNYTVLTNMTLSSGATILAYAGNNTCSIPFLWFYKDANGTIKTACAQIDASPLYAKDWSILPTVLGLKLCPNNILWTYTFSYDTDDINGRTFGNAWNSTDVYNIVNFYDNYSMPVTLAMMNMADNDSDWQAIFPLIASRPDVFQIVDHPSLQEQSLEIPIFWNILANWYNLNPTYYYLIPGAHWINNSVASYLYQNYSIKLVRQALNATGYGQMHSDWLSVNSSIWAPFGSGISFFNSDNQTGINWSVASQYFYDYESWLHGVYLNPAANLDNYCGYTSIMWDHYPELSNEEPILKALKDGMFDLGLYKLVPTVSSYAALASRTFQGSYIITNPIYYPSNKTLTFSLTDLKKAPDNVCGIVLPTTKAKMDDQIFYAPGHVGLKWDSGAFLEFNYVAGKTYTVYLDQEETSRPYATTYNHNAQLWIANSEFMNNQLRIDFQAPNLDGLKSTIEVYTGSLGAPLSVEGATGSFNNMSKIETLTIMNLQAPGGQGLSNSPANQGINNTYPSSVYLVFSPQGGIPEFPSSLLSSLLIIIVLSVAFAFAKTTKAHSRFQNTQVK